MDDTTVNSLYEHENGSIIDTQREMPLAIRAKAMALLDRATRLARQAAFVFQRRKHNSCVHPANHSSPRRLTHDLLHLPPLARVALESSSDTLFWDSYHTLDFALVGFRNSLPPLSSPPQSPGNRPGNSGRSGPGSSDGIPPVTYEVEERLHTVFFAHVASLTAVILVHDIFASRDESERWIVVRAANDIAGIVHGAANHSGLGTGEGVLDPRKTHMLVGVSPSHVMSAC